MSKISVITPTHNTTFLEELYDSLEAQSLTDWEWIILLNGDAVLNPLSRIKKDKRVKIYNSNLNSENIVGALKKEAFSLASTEYLVEVDHDDILVDECLEKVYEAFEENENIGFVYSADAKLAEEFTPYSSEYGWTYKTFNYKGRNLISMNPLPITPANIAHIWWSPNHVRAWRKNVYHKIGGHNETLAVCDDNDLMCRTYLETEFKYIPEVLYIYRIHSDSSNTWLQKNDEIQKLTREIGEHYIEELALVWSERNDLWCIDLCGGFNSPDSYTSVDLSEEAEIKADLNEKWPFEDSSVGIIRAFDAIEHLKDPIHTMREVWRVLAPGGLFLSMTPSTDGRGAFQDPTHISFWNENSFWYWTRNNIAKYINNNDCIFREIKLETLFPSEWHVENKICYVKAILDKVPVGIDTSKYK